MLTKIYRSRDNYKNYMRRNKGYCRKRLRWLVLTLNEGRLYPYCLPGWQGMFHRNNKKHGDRRRTIIKTRNTMLAIESWHKRRVEEVIGLTRREAVNA